VNANATSEGASCLFDEGVISTRVAALGSKISLDYAGKEVVLLAVMKGSLVFAADLIRHITVPVHLETVRLRSYQRKRSTGRVEMVQYYDQDQIPGKHVLIVEDIVDSGLTVHWLMEHLQRFGPASVKVCSLLVKPLEVRRLPVPVHYWGFQVPADSFVVGYGLDYDEKYRNKPFVATMSILTKLSFAAVSLFDAIFI